MYSLVGDYFPENKISTINGILVTGSYLGASCSSLSIMLTARFGWRNCYNIMGAFGVFFGLLGLIFVREPKRGQQKAYAEGSWETVKEEARIQKEEDGKTSLLTKFKGALSDIMTNPVTRFATIGTMFRFFSMFACDYFMPAFFLKNYP
jgi:MFS family permease